ncbi:AraC family transcriptional regulator [Carboxylicivirga taeanensis]|uniref:AraC family transcriptional regulator n=1 Tax=Carboxylicivirga taeanensis TaxID=1416875 RepID=UPI003F6E0B4B
MDFRIKNEKELTKRESVVLPDNILAKLLADPISKNLHLTDIGFYPKAKHHYRARECGCNQFILIYCIEGEGWISLNGKKVNIGTNQYFVLPPHVPHAYSSSKAHPWSIYWVHFTGELAEHFYDPTNVPKTIPNSDHYRIDDRIQLFNEIMKILEMGYSTENLQYANICLLHFLSSFKYISQYKQIQKEDETDVITKSISYMKQNLTKKQNLNALASESKLSVSQYSSLFRKKTGRSPIDYLTNLRIQKACQLLDNSNLQISAIAKRVSYSDPFHFSRIFKQVMGCSPLNYRKQPKG